MSFCKVLNQVSWKNFLLNSSKGLMTFLFVFVLSLVPSTVTATHPDDQESNYPFIVSGVVRTSEAKILKTFVSYLSQESDYPMYLVYAESYQALSDILENNTSAVAWTCGVPYVEDSEAFGQQLISVPLFRGKPVYHSVIITRTERAEKNLAEFSGGVFAYSDPRSNSGFIVPVYSLKREGIDINKHFRLLVNAHDHVGSIQAVMGGFADVAAVDEYIWVEYKEVNPEAKNKLREVENIGPFPFTPIVGGKDVNLQVIEKLQNTLISMHRNRKGQKMLEDLGLDGFIVKPPSFYQPIKEMLEYVRATKK